jgi:AraC-like DNA-binding protein
VTLSRVGLELAFAEREPVLAKVCQRFCEQVLSEQPPASELADSISVVLVNQPGRFLNIDEIAAHLGTSLRTLNRRLPSEGMSYQSIIDDVRRTLAMEYLERAALSVEEVCARVGFSDPSNFRKAFRKWTGRSPSHFRAETVAAGT